MWVERIHWRALARNARKSLSRVCTYIYARIPRIVSHIFSISLFHFVLFPLVLVSVELGRRKIYIKKKVEK